MSKLFQKFVMIALVAGFYQLKSGGYTPPAMGKNPVQGSSNVTPQELQELASQARIQEIGKLYSMRLDGQINVQAVQEEYADLLDILKNTDMSAVELVQTKAEFDATESFMQDHGIEVPDAI